MKKTKIISVLKNDSCDIVLDEDIITKHVLFIGSTGSGKTTTLNVLLRDLISHKSANSAEKLGLLIFDFKNDGTLEKVKIWAKNCGRISDVIDFSEGSKYFFNPLKELHNFEQASGLAEILISVKPQVDSGNSYWEHAIKKRVSMLLQYALLQGNFVEFSDFINLFQNFMNGKIRDYIYTLNECECACTELLKPATDIEQAEYSKLLHITKNLQMLFREWLDLDARTKSNEVSTLSNLFEAFSSPNGLGFLQKDNSKQELSVSEIVYSGKIIVLTLPGTTERGMASAIARMLKAAFYKAVQTRTNARLAGIIMDEFPLCVSAGDNIASDSFNMQTIRSKGGFVVAATQGICGLDCVIGERERRLLMLNFNSMFIFRSSEIAVQNICESMIKNHSPSKQIGFLAKENSEEKFSNINVDSLSAGYAYVKLANGFQTPRAVKMKRLFPKILTVRKQRHSLQRRCMKAIKRRMLQNKILKERAEKNELEFCDMG